jgi:hypothetical protein
MWCLRPAERREEVIVHRYRVETVGIGTLRRSPRLGEIASAEE